MAMCRCAHLAAGDDSALSGCYESSFIEDTPSPVADQGRRGDVVEPPRFVAQVTECRANPVVSHRGYLLVSDATDDAAASPGKRWVVSVHMHQLRDFQLTRYLLHPFLDSILRRFASHFRSF